MANEEFDYRVNIAANEIYWEGCGYNHKNIMAKIRRYEEANKIPDEARYKEKTRDEWIQSGINDEAIMRLIKMAAPVVKLDKDGCVTNCKYQVMYIDEYNNIYLIGFYNDLKDAEPDINDYLKGYEAIDEDTGEIYEPQLGDEHIGHLTEYASTYGMCFDKDICVQEGCLQIRGFIFQ